MLELQRRTECNRAELDIGSVASVSSSWNLTGSLIQRISIPVEETLCSKHNSKMNAFLPISELTRAGSCERIYGIFYGTFKLSKTLNKT